MSSDEFSHNPLTLLHIATHLRKCGISPVEIFRRAAVPPSALLNGDGWGELLHAQSINSSTLVGKPDSESDDILTLTVKARLQRVGREMRMLVENADDQTSADPGLLRIIARAHDIQERLMQNGDLTIHAIASEERVSAGYISRLLRLPSLAPDIITAIINGKNPPQLTAKKLMRIALQIPVDWTAQRKLLEFHSKATNPMSVPDPKRTLAPIGRHSKGGHCGNARLVMLA
jgi:hypothetical protein